MLHAVIKVDLDVLIGKMMDLFLVLLQFGSLLLNLLLLFGQLHALAALAWSMASPRWASCVR